MKPPRAAPEVDLYAPDRTFVGLPGTGKTTTLLKLMERELESGLSINDIAVTTYRKLMAEEFQERAFEAAGEEPEDHQIRTTHAICFRLLGLESRQVCDDAERAKFCDDFGVEFNGSVRRPGTDREAPLGNELFTGIDYARNILADPTEAYRECPTLSASARQSIGRSRGSLLERFYAEYEEFKADRGLLDFTDMLREVVDRGIAPDATVLIEDEFQDKSPLQLLVYNEWAAAADRVHVGGDPFQAIYAFQGSDPTYMDLAAEIAREETTLDTSYRFGPDCWDYATNILRRAGYDVPEIEPIGETEVRTIDADEYPRVAASVADDRAFHLVRANYQKPEIARSLLDAGVVFTGTGGYGWTPEMRHAYNAVALLREGLDRRNIRWDAFAPPEEAALARALPQSCLGHRRKDIIAELSGGGRGISTFIDAESAADRLCGGNPMRAIRGGFFGHGSEKRLLAQAWQDRGGDHINTIPHTLSTIHGSKGREATHVFLHDLTTPNTSPPAADEGEARVYFVGATRAEEALWIVRHGSMESAGLPAAGVVG